MGSSKLRLCSIKFVLVWILILPSFSYFHYFAQESDSLKILLFSDINNLLESARETDAPHLSPGNFNNAMEHFREAENLYREGESLDDIREELAITGEFLNKSIENAKIAKIVLADLIDLRQKIIAYKVYQYEPDGFNEAEDLFNEAVLQIEEDDIEDARSISQEAKEIYSEIAVSSIELSMLESARELLESNEDSITSEQYDSADENLDLLEDNLSTIKMESGNIDNIYSEFYGKITESFFYSGIEVPVTGIKKLQDKLPDTLTTKNFDLVIKEYTTASLNKVSGIAEIFFTNTDCIPKVTLIDSVILINEGDKGSADTLKSLSMIELNELKSVRVFDKRGLVFSPEINNELLAGLSSKYAPSSPNSFVVNFSNLEIPAATGKKAKVIKGNIQQRFKDNLQFSVNEFKVIIKSISISPDSAIADILIRPPLNALTYSNTAKPLLIEIGRAGITKNWEINKIIPDRQLDHLAIGNTGIKMNAKGVTIDFNKIEKKILLHSGNTIPETFEYPNNTGYLYGDYIFTNAEIIGCEGLFANLVLQKRVMFETLIPLSFMITLDSGNLRIERNWIKDGQFSGEVVMPKSVSDQNGNIIKAAFTSLAVDSALSLRGDASINKNQKIVWNNFQLETATGYLLIPGIVSKFSVVPLDTSYFAGYDSVSYDQIDPVYVNSKLKDLPGLTFNLFSPVQTDRFSVKTPDVNSLIEFNLQTDVLHGWLNISTEGVSGHLQSKEELTLIDSLRYGIKNFKEADSTFSARVLHDLKNDLWVEFKFVKNAVCGSNLSGDLFLPYPCNFTANYNDLNVTSTAELVGGNVFFEERMLDYWGVLMTAEKKGNYLSIDNKEILFLNSSISEPIHFAEPFGIIWGEIYGSGSLGRFIFDLNSNGQKFDGLPLLLHDARLSEYKKSKPTLKDTLGYLNAYGDLYFDLFGAHRMDIVDYKDARPGHNKKPFNGRFATVNKKRSVLDIDKKWGSGTADFNFSVDYDHADQNGFKGTKLKHPMKVELNLSALVPVSLIQPDEIDLNSYSSWIYFCAGGGSRIDLAVNQMAALTTIGGLILIKGDKLERFVLEGHASVKSFSYEAQAEAHSLASLTITPNNITFNHRGYLAFTGLNVQLFGLAGTSLVLNKKAGSLEGTVMGVFQGASGLNFLVRDDRNKLEARGQFNFYTGLDAVYIQGYGDISAKFGVSLECEGAFFTGFHAPTQKIWVLDKLTRGPSIRGILSGRGINYLTGFYIGGSFSYGMDLGVIEGRYKLWGGLGYFLDQNNINQILLGHGGVELSGSLLWGLVSGSAWAEMQTKLDLPVPNFYMSGTLGIEACVLFACTSWSGTLCISTDKGIQTGECN